jgi:beta-glucosidase
MKYEKIISQLSLEEKASLMSGKNCWETKDIKKAGIPSIFLSDGPNGLRKQIAAADQLGFNPSLPATCFPAVSGVANSWNIEVGETIGKTLGEEAKSLKSNVVLGPGLNMKRNPLCGRNFEYFSEDPYLAGKMAASYVKGIQSNGVASCIKHFACNSQELKREDMDSVVDERTLREIYLTAFEIAVKEGGAMAVMSAYNRINGEFANENKHLLIEILRKEWDFKGTVITDWGGENDRVEGIKCQNALEMPSNNGDTNRDIVNAVKEGRLEEKVLDECVDQLLDLAFTTKKATEGADKEFDIYAHNDIAEKCAEESMVLLKNEKNVLPLKGDEKVAVIGDFAFKPRYQGAGSSGVNPTLLGSTLNYIIKDEIKSVGFQKGFKRFGGKSICLRNKAVHLAQKADVLLVYLGLDENKEVEGIDRKNIKLAKNQLDLIKALKKTGKKIVAIISCGSVVDMSFADDVDAILYASLGGQAGAQAALKLIYGDINPSGKLSETIPYKYEDVPSAKYFPGKEKTAEYREGLFIGYRYYETAKVPVRYPFGYGLSYTTFSYSDLEINESGVSFSIANTGEREGKEAAQLYVGKKDSRIIRPAEELKGFIKVDLNPGEKIKTTIPFDDKTFRYFNVKTGKWEIEGGTYQIMIGSSSENILLKGEISKDATTDIMPYTEKELPDYFKGNIKNIPNEEFQKLLGHNIPEHNYHFIKRHRIVVDHNTTMSDLKYARGWTGRFFAGAVRFAINLLRFLKLNGTANLLVMSITNQTVKVLSRTTGGAISWDQLQGLITMFNGHFHKGLHQFFKAGRDKKALAKQKKALDKEEK